MDILFKTFLFLHILSGSIGLITGTINIIRKKGDRRHKLTGKIFAYSMLITGVSALVLSVLHTNYFLFIVGVFTIYLVGTGYRYIYLKMSGSDLNPNFIDRALTFGMLIAGIAFIVYGIYILISGNNFGIVLMVFGIIGSGFVKTDIQNYKGKSIIKNYRLLAHLQRMTGGYIAAATAFLVVNAKYSPVELPPILFWLLPTIILTPLIIKWSRKYSINKT